MTILLHIGCDPSHEIATETACYRVAVFSCREHQASRSVNVTLVAANVGLHACAMWIDLKAFADYATTYFGYDNSSLVAS